MPEKITKYNFRTYTEYKNEKGEYYNINDEPAVIRKDGTKYWYRNGKLHRTKGPAIIYSEKQGPIFYSNKKEIIGVMKEKI